MIWSTKRIRDGSTVYLPTLLKSNRLFVRLSCSQKPVRFPVTQNECVHKATPSLYPPAAPSGITHYTFVPKVVCQREKPPPLETPPALSEMGTHTGIPRGYISSKSAKQKRRELSPHDSRTALFCSPSAPRSRKELPPFRVNSKQK